MNCETVFNLVVLVMILVGIAFVTLFERKVLGLIQFRLGPNKVLLWGIFQPLGDALKLLGKSMEGLGGISSLEYYFMPLGMMLIMMLVWMFIPVCGGYNVRENGVLIVICVLSLGVFPIMFGGWFSSSLYSMMGSVRVVAQMISYEVSFIMVIMMMVYMGSSFSFTDLYNGCFGFLWMYPVLILFLMSVVIELNRTPVDLIEGESELVSGFNIDFYSLEFAMVFLGEYGLLVFLSGFFVSLSFGLLSFSVLWVLCSFMMVFIIVMMRGVFPRVRYDELMFTCWVSILGVSLGILMVVLGVVLLLGLLV